MSTQSQVDYIRDLAVKKLKEFKEFKELLQAQDITDVEGDSVNDIMYKLNDEQASRVIDALIARPEPTWQKRYADKRIKQAADLLDEIVKEIEEWDFELR